MGKEEFKTFVKKNPKLIKYVQDGSSSWQKFYEIYENLNNYGDLPKCVCAKLQGTDMTNG